MKYTSWSFQIGAKFQSGKIFSLVLIFWTETVLNEWPALKLILTLTSTDLGKEDYTKDVDNFDSFPENINTPLSERFMSNDL
jgi:hypothetical protein